jgi:ABC-type uncharacterized transport system substrate-binding protein
MKVEPMRRRDFITLLGRALSAWPLAAWAQQPGVPVAGYLGGRSQASSVDTVASFRRGLGEGGFVEGRNVANGLVLNIARPEGNITGFSVAEPSIAGKRLELLKEAVPSLTRVAVIFNPETAATARSYISSIEAAAVALGVEAIKTPVRSAVDIVRGIDAFATAPNGGLLVLPPSPFPETLRQLVTQHRLPAIESGQFGARVGSLLEFAADDFDRFRGAASYVDRLLRGAKVSELPVQFPTKFKLVVNLKTAKAIGLTIPEAFLLRADELIE